MSQILLCDELARKCFRGTEEAFAYDSVSLKLSLQLIESMESPPADRLPGQFYSPFVAFMMLPLMHSETLEHHETDLKIIDDIQEGLRTKKENGSQLMEMFDLQRSLALNHKAVLDRFGWYPHRNGN